MAGANDAAMVIAVGHAGGLGSLPCAMLTPAEILEQVAQIRSQTNAPLNLNFFCHTLPNDVDDSYALWLARLQGYYREQGLQVPEAKPVGGRKPFDEAMCEVVETVGPEVVSFHFGLPEVSLMRRVKNTGAVILSSATTVREAVWLESHGCDVVIAQGLEAGGHRGQFLESSNDEQMGTFSLVPQIRDAINCPLIAAGGISDGRGLAAALLLGASAVQVGSAYLYSSQATITRLHRAALLAAAPGQTVVTNVFSGRAARGLGNRLTREIGPMAVDAPEFPFAGNALIPLKLQAEGVGRVDFSALWSGQSAGLARPQRDEPLDAGALTRSLAEAALQRLNARQRDA